MTSQDLQQQYEAFRPLVEWAQTPEGQAALAEVGGGLATVRRKERRWRPGSPAGPPP